MQGEKNKFGKINIRKGDNVLVLSGKDKGKKGKILRLIKKSNRAVVEGINIVKKHQRPTQKFQGGIVERPAPVVISKLMIVCVRCNKPARVAHKNSTRICKKCGEVMDKK